MVSQSLAKVAIGDYPIWLLATMQSLQLPNRPLAVGVSVDVAKFVAKIVLASGFFQYPFTPRWRPVRRLVRSIAEFYGNTALLLKIRPF